MVHSGSYGEFSDGLLHFLVMFFPTGYGVFTTKEFKTGDFLLEYRGDLISHKDGLQREKTYKSSQGSFLYFFKDGQNGTKWW